MNNQYIERYMNKNIDTKSYEMVIPTLDSEDEPVKGLNKTGVLMLKNRIDKIEYHLYNSKLPESVDINETLGIHLYSVTKQPIHISISDLNNIIFEGTGKLIRRFENKIEKFYLVEKIGNGFSTLDTDLETILFYNTDVIINIKINTVHKEEVIVDEKGNQEDESRDEQQS
jgi:hypothetical protein